MQVVTMVLVFCLSWGPYALLSLIGILGYSEVSTQYNCSFLAGGDIRQKLKFHHVHLELGALGYIETFLFYWSWGFFQKKKTTMAKLLFPHITLK